MSAYQKLMSGLFGGAIDPEEEKRLTEAQRKAAQQRGITDFATAMLGASGYSRTPVSLGQALGQGMQAGREGFAGGAMGSMQANERMRAEDAARAQAEAAAAQERQLQAYIATLPPEQRAAFAAMGSAGAVKALGARANEQAKADFRAPKRSSYGQTALDAGYQEGTPEFRQYVDRLATQSRAPVFNIDTRPQLSPGRKKVDENFAPEYIDWRAKGGATDVNKQLDQLDEALQIVETSPGITGPIIGNLPSWAAAFVNRDGTVAKENIEEVVQRNLRVILGAQFTEKEGERLIARAYNPRLPPAENAKRVRRLITQIRGMAEAKEASASYFEENGTLMGFNGRAPTPADLSQLNLDDDEDEERRRRGGFRILGVR
jgi:hypothetical protein